MEDKIYSAKTLGDAITDACAELGVTSDKLDYKIIQEGKNGFFGIGAKPYIISVSIRSEKKDSFKDKKAGRDQKASKPENKENKEQREVKEAKDNRENKEASFKKDQKGRGDKNQSRNREDQPKEGKQQGGKNGKRKPEKEQNSQAAAAGKDNRSEKPVKKDRPERGERPEKIQERTEGNAAVRNEAEAKAGRRPERTGTVNGDPVKTAEEFLTGLFASMEMNINYQGQFKPENNELVVNLSGEDMGVLIGKRGQTLDALQYLTSQVVNKHQTAYIRVKLDTENYRERRKETMEALALNIAQKVRKTKRPVALEPMNPYERRIIHSVLQADKEVVTRSEGVEPYRHVVVCPVRKKKGIYGKQPVETAAEEKTAENDILTAPVETAEIRVEDTADTSAETKIEAADNAVEMTAETVTEIAEETEAGTVAEVVAETIKETVAEAASPAEEF